MKKSILCFILLLLTVSMFRCTNESLETDRKNNVIVKSTIFFKYGCIDDIKYIIGKLGNYARRGYMSPKIDKVTKLPQECDGTETINFNRDNE